MRSIVQTWNVADTGSSSSRVQRISSQWAISLLSQWNKDTETDDDDSNDNNYSHDDIHLSSASDLSSD